MTVMAGCKQRQTTLAIHSITNMMLWAEIQVSFPVMVPGQRPCMDGKHQPLFPNLHDIRYRKQGMTVLKVKAGSTDLVGKYAPMLKDLAVPGYTL
jgi:hypothetical protein